MDTIKSIIMFCGAISFGSLASTVLHELGHAVLCWAFGGTVERMVLNRYDMSYVQINMQSGPADMVMLLGGATIAVLIGLLMVGVGLEIRSPYQLPFTIAGMFAFGVNGIYYMGWRDIDSGGDPAQLLYFHDFPGWLLTLIALFFLLMLLLALPRMAPLLGIAPNTSIGKRWLVLLGGSLPFLVGWSLYHGWFDFITFGLLPLALWIGVALALWIIAWLSTLVQDKEAPVAHFGVLPLLYSLGMGILPFIIPMEYVFIK